MQFKRFVSSKEDLVCIAFDSIKKNKFYILTSHGLCFHRSFLDGVLFWFRWLWRLSTMFCWRFFRNNLLIFLYYFLDHFAIREKLFSDKYRILWPSKCEYALIWLLLLSTTVPKNILGRYSLYVFTQWVLVQKCALNRVGVFCNKKQRTVFEMNVPIGNQFRMSGTNALVDGFNDRIS